MQWIAGQTLGSNNTTVQFTSIPQNFTHLQLRIFGKSQTNGAMSLFFNTVSSGTSYSYHYLQGDGATPTSAGFASQSYMSNLIGNTNATYWGVHIIDILDYANANKNKVVRDLNGWDGNGSGYVQLYSGQYMSLSAITQIDAYNGYTWTAGTRIDLYGITTSQLTGA